MYTSLNGPTQGIHAPLTVGTREENPSRVHLECIIGSVSGQTQHLECIIGSIMGIIARCHVRSCYMSRALLKNVTCVTAFVQNLRVVDFVFQCYIVVLDSLKKDPSLFFHSLGGFARK